jgi:hypothetical protein
MRSTTRSRNNRTKAASVAHPKSLFWGPAKCSRASFFVRNVIGTQSFFGRKTCQTIASRNVELHARRVKQTSLSTTFSLPA